MIGRPSPCRIPVEAWVDRRPLTVDVIVHHGQVTMRAGDTLIEFPSSVWHRLTLRVLTALAVLDRRRHPR